MSVFNGLVHYRKGFLFLEFSVGSDKSNLAEEVGFEPTRRVNGLRDFESRLFDHLSTPPNIQLSEF